MIEEGIKDKSLQSKLLEYASGILKLAGVYPHQKIRYSSYAYFNILSHLVIMALTVYMICCDLNDISNVMLGIEAFTSHIHGLLKYLPVLLHRNELILLIDDLPRFWRTKNADEYHNWIKLTKIFLVLLVSTTISFLLFPGILFVFYVPDFPNSHIVMIIIQKGQFFYTALMVLGTDLLYLSFCGIIKVQYMMLKEDLRFLVTSENKHDLLKLWIEQHVFLTKYTKSFVHIFNEALLMQYLVANINLCSELYFISQRGTSGVLMSLLIILSMLFEVSLLCLGASQVTSIAAEVADVLCSIEWYDLPLEEMKILPLLIQQAQVPMIFVAGGLVNMDQRAITTVLKNSYSFYALVSQMQQT